MLHSDVVVNPHLDTASQRPPTGLDAGARRLIVTATQARPAAIVSLFFRDTYADYDDYSRAVSDVWGLDQGETIYNVVHYAEHGDPMLLDSQSNRSDDVASALLQYMPEPDFRAAIAKAYSTFQARSYEQEERITQICRSRSAPWSFTLEDGFVWTGDAEIETQVMTPALTALADPRFAGGVKTEFESARQELALGTPSAQSQSVQQAGAAVESAMKVVLDELGVAYQRDRDTAFVLFDHLKDNRLIESFMKDIVLGTVTPRNRRAAHGAGQQPHAVPVEVAGRAGFGSSLDRLPA
jgi:hypothetical protein